MILLEIFDDVARFQLTADNTGYFSVGENKYVVEFNETDEPNQYEVGFSLRQGVTPSGQPNYVHGVEGTGGEFKVFATVLAIIKQFLSTRQLHQLIFTSKTSEPSRMKLYDRMVHRLMVGWNVRVYNNGDSRQYEITNPNFGTSTNQGPQSTEDMPF